MSFGGPGRFGGGGSICNICQQPGHFASVCPNGQVDWVKKLGDRAFRLRPPVYWSEDPSNPKNRRLAHADEIYQHAQSYAHARCYEVGLSPEELDRVASSSQSLNNDDVVRMSKNVDQMRQKHMQAALAARQAAAAAATGAPQVALDTTLPPGWGAAVDAQGRTYYWEKTTGTVQWNRPG